MLLKQGKNGEIYQTDSSFDDERGVGRIAPLVEDDDLLKLSVNKDRQEIIERLEARRMTEAGKKNYWKQQLIFQAKEDLKSRLQELAQYIQNKAKTMADNNASKANQEIKIKAIYQGTRYLEDIGVSGDGLTPEGAKPYPLWPARDYHKVDPVAYDFGKMGAMGINVTAVADSPYETMKATATPIKGGFTSYHRFLINLWDKSQYSVRYFQMAYAKNPDGTLKLKENGQPIFVVPKDPSFITQVIDLRTKKQIWDRAEAQVWLSKHIGNAELVKSSQRGWMWSGWHNEEGNWVQVKVPFVYGLPMDLPEVFNTPENMEKLKNYRNYRMRSDFYSYTLFDSFKEIIEAYAMFYKYVLGEAEYLRADFSPDILAEGEKPAQQEEVKEQILVEENRNVQAAAEGDKKVVKEATKLASGNDLDFRHPMAQKGLL